MEDDDTPPTSVQATRNLIAALRSFLTLTQGMSLNAQSHTPAPVAVFGMRDAVVGSLAIYDALVPEDDDLEDWPPKVERLDRMQALRDEYGEMFADKIEKLVAENNELSRKLREAQAELEARPTQFIHVEPEPDVDTL